MIKIEIIQTVYEEVTTPKSFVTKETPTEITEQTAYSSGREVKFVKEYEVRDVTEKIGRRVELLSQEITDDSKFDLAEVIIAINRLDKETK